MGFVKATLLIISVSCFLINVVTASVAVYRKRTEKRLNLEMKAEQMEIYKKAYLDYKKKYDDLKQMQSNRVIVKIPEGTVDAVRYAMIYNHPDNGGDPEKFILYRSCYEKLTGKKS